KAAKRKASSSSADVGAGDGLDSNSGPSGAPEGNSGSSGGGDSGSAKRAQELAAKSIASTATAAASAIATAGRDKEMLVSGVIDDGTLDELKTVPLRGWGKNVETELGRWQDVRACCLCKVTGDGDKTGRLLPLDDGQWIHTLCGLWSREVYENQNNF
ncbi:unnamed protein product, partial [Ectocarpus sp. 12 AP-2014]